jgi:hypothetical protein
LNELLPQRFPLLVIDVSLNFFKKIHHNFVSFGLATARKQSSAAV